MILHPSSLLDNLAVVNNWQPIQYDILMFLTINPYQISYRHIKFKSQCKMLATSFSNLVVIPPKRRKASLRHITYSNRTPYTATNTTTIQLYALLSVTSMSIRSVILNMTSGQLTVVIVIGYWNCIVNFPTDITTHNHYIISGFSIFTKHSIKNSHSCLLGI